MWPKSEVVLLPKEANYERKALTSFLSPRLTAPSLEMPRAAQLTDPCCRHPLNQPITNLPEAQCIARRFSLFQENIYNPNFTAARLLAAQMTLTIFWDVGLVEDQRLWWPLQRYGALPTLYQALSCQDFEPAPVPPFIHWRFSYFSGWKQTRGRGSLSTLTKLSSFNSCIWGLISSSLNQNPTKDD